MRRPCMNVDQTLTGRIPHFLRAQMRAHQICNIIEARTREVGHDTLNHHIALRGEDTGRDQEGGGRRISWNSRINR